MSRDKMQKFDRLRGAQAQAQKKEEYSGSESKSSENGEESSESNSGTESDCGDKQS